MKKKQKIALFTQFIDALKDDLVKQLSPVGFLVYDSGLELLSLVQYLDLFDSFSRTDFAILHQLANISKRYIGKGGSSTEQERKLRCYETFCEINTLCSEQNSLIRNVEYPTWLEHVLIGVRADLENLFWRRIESVDSEFVMVGENQLLPISGFNVGPGTVCRVDGLSPIEKYEMNDLTVSNERGCMRLKTLSKLHKPLFDLVHSRKNAKVKIDGTVKASMVDKNERTLRMIIPQHNGDLIQQYPAESFLRGILKIIGITLDSQPDINRELARKGSLHDNYNVDGRYAFRSPRYCTIDLKSASDLIGRELYKFSLPHLLYKYLEDVSPTHVSFTTDLCDSPVPLHMLANMGNAFCFPLQTLFFAALVRYAYRVHNIPLRRADGHLNYGVFGDDIIVDVAVYDYLIRVMEGLRMVPNTSKSYSRGLFRESCGCDYWSGYDVRPVFCETLDSPQDIFSLTNRLTAWGFKHGLSVSLSLNILLKDVKVVCVPMDFAEDSGLRVPYLALSAVPPRWRANVRIAYRIATDGVSLMSTPRFTNRSNDYVIFSTSFYKKERLKMKIRKPTDSMISLLIGGIRQEGSSKTFWVNSKRLVPTIDTVDVPVWDSYHPLWAGTVSRFMRNIYDTYAWYLAKQLGWPALQVVDRYTNV